MASNGVATLAVACPECADAVAAVVHGTAYVHEPHLGPPELWTLCSCPKCGRIMLFLQEDYGQGMDDPWRLYPAQARRMSDAVPEALREDHDEATRCLAIKAYRASAVMARRIVEGICIDQGYKTGVLQKRLATMRDDGKIDKRLFEWADALRVLGNDGAHAGNMPISRNDAHEVMALVEALLDYLYVFQARFEEFLRNRDASAE